MTIHTNYIHTQLPKPNQVVCKLSTSWQQFCPPRAQLVECRTSDNLLIPVIQRARVRDASALDILEPPDGDVLRSGQRPQPVEVSEWDGPCPAMWAR